MTKKTTAARACTLAALFLTSASFAMPAAADGEVNIYSYRQPFLIEPSTPCAMPCIRLGPL